MNLDTATREVTRMFAAFGHTKPAEVIREFAHPLTDARCDACAFDAIAEMRDTASKPPASVAALRGAIYDRTSSTNHYPHLSESTRESQAGKAEGFWRSEAVRTVEAELKCDRLHAEYIASRLWYLAACPADAATIREECKHALWVYLAGVPVSPELVAHNWDMARRVAVRPIEEWKNEEWNAACGRETQLLAEASA